MKWHKLAHYLPPIPGYTHAACPTWYDGLIYFSPRKELSGRSNIFRASFDPKTLALGTPELVALEGRIGQFDDAGRMVCCVNETGIYYVGWNIGITVPFRNALGRLGQDGPILDRSGFDPCMVASAWVDGEHLYYTSGEDWVMRGLRMEAQYRIKYGNVKPASHAKATGIVVIDYENDWAITKPCVLPGRQEMFYCYRGDQYRIGYATSHDGLHWQRKDDLVNLPLGEWGKDFDDDAQCYPCVFDHEGSRYLLYNGNRYGKTGFGVAILESD